MFDRFQQLTGAAVVGALAVLAPTAMAADQGAISDTASEGRLDVTLDLPALVRISALQDIDLGTFDGTALDGSDDVCVWSTTRAYSITATGDGGGGAFTLTGNTNGDVVAYAVEWADDAGQTSGTTLTSGNAVTGRTTNATTTDCNGGNDPNATVIVAVAEDDLAAVTADNYSGTLTLLVEPD
jgi:hypothetical protein